MLNTPEMSDSVVQQHTNLVQRFAGRVGICLLVTPRHDHMAKSDRAKGALEDAARIEYEALVHALGDDARVKRLNAPPGPSQSLQQHIFSSAGRSETQEGETVPSSPHRHVHSIRFGRQLTFMVDVPRRLQRQKDGVQAIPAEEYWVSWNGVTIVVIWGREDSSNPFGSAGGLAALEIIRDAAKKAGLQTHVQPCSPTCGYPLSHQDLEIESGVDSPTVRLIEQSSRVTIVKCPSESEPLDVVARLGREFAYSSLVFATMRSHGASIENVESRARRELSELLQLQYDRADLSAKPYLTSIKVRWQKRGIRRRMLRTTASLWLRIATLEENLQQWRRARLAFDEAVAEKGLGALFASEYAQETGRIGVLEIGHLRAAVEQMSNSFDSRLVAVATAGGAIAGAVVGSLVAQLPWH